MNINEQFSTVPLYDYIGLVTGSATAVRFPSGTAKLVRFKTDSDNEGHFYLGHDDEHMFWQMAAGDDTGWVPIDLLERLWHQAPSGTAIFMSYWLQR